MVNCLPDSIGDLSNCMSYMHISEFTRLLRITKWNSQLIVCHCHDLSKNINQSINYQYVVASEDLRKNCRKYSIRPV